MKTGLVIYAGDLNRLLRFYQTVFDFTVVEKETSFAQLNSGEFELVLLETESSKAIQESQVIPRESSALKPTFFIEEQLQSISEKIIAKGGQIKTPKDWKFNGRLVCDGWDCEGNIFQLRIANRG